MTTALIVHPTYKSLTTQLEENLRHLEKTVEAVDKVLNNLALLPQIKELLNKLKEEERLIALLTASVHNTNDLSENITGETRNLRQFLDDDPSVKGQFEAARSKKMYRRLASFYHPDTLGAAQNPGKFSQVQKAYKSGAFEILYLLYKEAFSDQEPLLFEDEHALLTLLTGRSENKLFTFLEGTSFRIARAWLAGGKPKAELDLADELTLRIRAYQLYRTRKNSDAHQNAPVSRSSKGPQPYQLASAREPGARSSPQ